MLSFHQRYTPILQIQHLQKGRGNYPRIRGIEILEQAYMASESSLRYRKNRPFRPSIELELDFSTIHFYRIREDGTQVRIH